jgi:predicted nucleic acid-binding protein
MEGLSEVLRRHPCIALDSNVLLYFFEAHPEYGPLSRAVMKEVADGLPAVTGMLTLMDALVMPVRLKRQDLYDQHLAALTSYPNLSVLPIDRPAVEGAARLRARYPSLSTPDALTIALGQLHGATLYVTNDPRPVQTKEMPVLNLRDVVL